MYIIFDRNLGIFQFGFHKIEDLNIQHGIILQDHNLFHNLTQGNILIINNDYFLVDKNQVVLKSFRFFINQEHYKKFILILLKSILFVEKKKNIVQKCFLYLIYFLIFTKIFSINFHIEHENLSAKNNTNTWTVEDWKNFFKDTKFAEYINFNKYDYINNTVPKIKGIPEFRVLPLQSLSNNQEIHFTLTIALPYTIIYSLKKENSLYSIKPFYSCPNKKTNFFNINNKDEMIILKNNDHIGNDYEFIIFNEQYNKDNLCNTKPNLFEE